MKKITSIIIALLGATGMQAQTNINLKINHLLKDKSFAFNQTAQNDLNNNFNVKRLEYYISGISLIHDGGKVTNAKDVYILVDAGKNELFSLGTMDVTNVEAINFAIGVSPNVNNADPSAWPNGHALAPKSPSMHWGWSAGYRFVALEGKSGKDVNFTFEIHALGNKNYFKQSIPTNATIDNNEMTITLNADYTQSIKGIDVSSGLITHGEDDEAAYSLRNFQMNVFTSLDGKGNTLSVDNFKKPLQLNVYPNPNSGYFNIDLGHISINNASYEILDITGKLIQSGNASEQITVNEKGIYFLTVVLESGNRISKKICIQ